MSIVSSRSAGSTRARPLVWLGLLLIAGGLGVALYLVWEYFVTPVIAHHRESQVLAQLQRGWPGAGSTSVQTHWGTADAIIEIPRFGPRYRIPVFEGTGANVLAVGYGHFVGSAGPGQIGNYALAAHRVTHSEPLRHMPELKAGDVVRVVTRRTTYVYRLTTGGDDLVVPLTSRWVTTPLPRNPGGGVEPAQHAGERLITLTTCAELFHTDNREIAFGILTRAVPRTRPAVRASVS